MRPIRAIAFDAFGTVIHYNGHRINPYRRLVTEGGYPSPLSHDQSKKAERLPFLTRDVGVEVFAEELGLSHLLPVIQRELDTEIAGLCLFQEIDLVLRKLRAAGKRIAVVSNLAQPYGQSVRELLPDLDAYVLSYEVGAAKPDPAIYTAACKALSCVPGEVLFIGDSKRCDVGGPQAFGMQARHLDRKAGQTLLDVLAGVL
jgi:FMN phosphatase YigB (HAD superfamily)